MKGIIKLQILHEDGRKEKIGLEVQTGDKVPLRADTIGVDTGCFLDIGPAIIRIVATEGSQAFRMDKNTGKDFRIKVGSIFESDKFMIEFASIPEPDAEEATRYVKFQKPEVSPASPAPAAPFPDATDATQMILKMHVPERVMQGRPGSHHKLRSEVVGAPEQSDIDLSIRRKNILETGASFLMILTSAEGATALTSWLTGGTFRATFGLSTLVMLLFAATLVLALQQLKQRTPWFGPFVAMFRKAAYVSAATSLVLMIGFSGAFLMLSPKADNANASVAKIEQPAQEAPLPEAKPSTSPALVQMPAQAIVTTAPPPAKALPTAAETSPDMSNEVAPDMSKEEFFRAVRAGNLALVRQLIESRTVDVNYTLNRGFSALHYAAIRGDEATVRYLISKRANLNAKDPNGNTPLMWATFKRRARVVAQLVKAGSDLTVRREDGARAVDVAQRYNLESYIPLLTPKEKPRKVAGGKAKTTPQAGRSVASTDKKRPPSKTPQSKRSRRAF